MAFSQIWTKKRRMSVIFLVLSCLSSTSPSCPECKAPRGFCWKLVQIIAANLRLRVDNLRPLWQPRPICWLRAKVSHTERDLGDCEVKKKDKDEGERCFLNTWPDNPQGQLVTNTDNRFTNDKLGKNQSRKKKTKQIKRAKMNLCTQLWIGVCMYRQESSDIIRYVLD